MPSETLHDDVLDLPLAHEETAETFATEIEQLRAPLIGRLCANFPRLDRDKAEDLFQSLVLDLWTDSKYLTVSNLGG